MSDHKDLARAMSVHPAFARRPAEEVARIIGRHQYKALIEAQRLENKWTDDEGVPLWTTS